VISDVVWRRGAPASPALHGTRTCVGRDHGADGRPARAPARLQGPEGNRAVPSSAQVGDSRAALPSSPRRPRRGMPDPAGGGRRRDLFRQAVATDGGSPRRGSGYAEPPGSPRCAPLGVGRGGAGGRDEPPGLVAESAPHARAGERGTTEAHHRPTWSSLRQPRLWDAVESTGSAKKAAPEHRFSLQTEGRWRR
jgi:hypothetical protein